MNCYPILDAKIPTGGRRREATLEKSSLDKARKIAEGEINLLGGKRGGGVATEKPRKTRNKSIKRVPSQRKESKRFSKSFWNTGGYYSKGSILRVNKGDIMFGEQRPPPRDGNL